MKGIVFTVFTELVEDTFGLEMLDTIIEESNLASKGAYTSTGNYKFEELSQLLERLSHHTQMSVDDLLLAYSKSLFAVLIKSHPNLVSHYKSPMDLLASIEDHIHVEVQKIYPDAQLPSFTVLERTSTDMTLFYSSDKALYMLGKGLIEETFKLFKIKGTVTFEKMNEEGTEVKFFITQT